MSLYIESRRLVMKSIVSGLIWAATILVIALAARAGLIARHGASNVILVLAVLSAIQLAALPHRRGGCGACAKGSGR